MTTLENTAFFMSSSLQLLDQLFVDAMLEHAPFRIHFKDLQHRFIVVSRQKLLRHGFTSVQEIAGKSDADFFSPEHVKRSHEDEDRVARTGEPIISVDEKIVMANGDVSWGRVTRLPLRNEQGIIIGTFGYTEDITKEKELSLSLKTVQDALIEASRKAGMAEVATGVLHNVGNVLTSLNTSSTVIAESLRKSKAETLLKIAETLNSHPADIAAFVTEDEKGKRIPLLLESLSKHFEIERERLLQETESLIKSVAHIRETVSMQQSYATVAGLTEPLEVTALMDEAIRINQDSLSRHSIELIRDYHSVPIVMADKGKVMQILVNLIRNSAQACEQAQVEHPKIIARVTVTDSQRVQLCVIDNGIGIPKENLLKIFQHGFTTKQDGHGFGVHASANAARAMNGSLSCDSEGAMRGARFILELPISA